MVNHGNSFPYYHGLKNTIRINQDNSFLKPKRDVFWETNYYYYYNFVKNFIYNNYG